MVFLVPDPTVATPFPSLREVITYSFTNHSLSASVRGLTGLLKRDSPAYPHDYQVSEESGPDQESDRGSIPHNESFQRPSEGASPTGPGEKPGRPSFKCAECPVRCTQERVLKRHYQEKHQPRSKCLHLDCSYEWTSSRISEYRKHLTKKHMLEVDKIDKILGRPRRRRGRVIENDIPPYFSPPPIERDGQSLAELAYNPRLEHAEPEFTTAEHKDSNGLECFAATHAPSGLLSEEDLVLLGEHYKIHGRFRFPSVHPGGSTTADISPNLGMVHVPVLPSGW